MSHINGEGLGVAVVNIKNGHLVVVAPSPSSYKTLLMNNLDISSSGQFAKVKKIG